MFAIEGFIRRIVSRSGIVRSAARRDLERELQTHLEDALEEERSQGHEGPHLLKVVCDRFGDPDEIAREFEISNRFERRVILTADALVLMSLSVLVVAALILGLQLIIAASLGISPSHAFPRLRGELVAFVSLAFGYMRLYLEERLFRGLRLPIAFGVNSALYGCLFVLASVILHLNTGAPVLAFVAGITVRTLQRTPWQRVWYLGTVIPTSIACLSVGRLLSTENETSLWAAVFIRWVGLTAACYLLTLLSRSHEARYQASQ